MKSYRVEITARAERQLNKLSKPLKRRILDRIDALSNNPFPPDVKKLEGCDSNFRIRVGDYRVIYEVHNNELIVLVVKVKHRRDAYRSI